MRRREVTFECLQRSLSAESEGQDRKTTMSDALNKRNRGGTAARKRNRPSQPPPHDMPDDDEEAASVITPTQTLRQLDDGLYARPTGRPPVDGYSWNAERGVWIPGQRLQKQIQEQGELQGKVRALKSLKRNRGAKPERNQPAAQNDDADAQRSATKDEDKLTRESSKRRKSRSENLDEEDDVALIVVPITDEKPDDPVQLKGKQSKARSGTKTAGTQSTVPAISSKRARTADQVGDNSVPSEDGHDAVSKKPPSTEATSTVQRKRRVREVDSQDEISDLVATTADAGPSNRASVAATLDRKDPSTAVSQDKTAALPRRKRKRAPVASKSSEGHAVEKVAKKRAPVDVGSDRDGDSATGEAHADATEVAEIQVLTERDAHRKSGKSSSLPMYHPTSEWEEPHPKGTEPMLTLYEKHRKPRPVPSGYHACSISALQQEFRCIICLDYVRNARMVAECLHRFCDGCIERALVQVGRRNECPICRTYIPSRRSLAPDPGFDVLIQRILGDLAVSNVEESNTVAATYLQSRQKLHKDMSTASDSQVQKEVSVEKTDSSIQSLTEDSKVAASETMGCDANDGAETKDDTPNLVNLVLLRAEDEKVLDELRQPYLTIAGDAPVGVLQSFLKQKLGFVVPSIDVMSLHQGQAKTLSPSVTIQSVANVTNDDPPGAYVPLYYRGRKADDIVSSTASSAQRA